jgi:hypothetical protein
MDPEVAARRRVEVERAPNLGAIMQAEARWKAEDAVSAQQPRQGEVAALRRELADLRLQQAADARAANGNFRDLLGTADANGRPSSDCLIGALLARIERLEARPAPMVYCGVWSARRQYVLGDLVTHDGAGWVLVEPVAQGQKPGGNGWRLAIKAPQSDLRRMVRDEVAKQLEPQTPAKRTAPVTVR